MTDFKRSDALIRAALPEDAEAIHEVHMAAIRGLCSSHYGAAEIDAWCGGRSPSNYLSPIREKVVLVAEVNARIRGFGQLDPKGLIEAVYVHPDHPRQGIGMALLRALESCALRLGCKVLRLDSSLNAVGFYAAAGYRTVERCTHEIRPGIFIPCERMEREFDATWRR
jgi:putative acetyltransferase